MIIGNRVVLITITIVILAFFFILSDRKAIPLTSSTFSKEAKANEVLKANMMLVNSSSESVDSSSKKNDKPIFEKGVKDIISNIQTNYNEKLSRTLWHKFLENSFDVNKKLLRELRGAGAGWVLYQEIAERINEGELSDETVAYLIKILTDAFEGGSFDNDTYFIAKNTKDQLIQSVMKNQLLTPTGKASLKISLDLLYMLEGGTQETTLEESLLRHSSLLTDEEIFEYRLHYAQFNEDRMYDAFRKINNSNINSGYNSIIFEKLNNSVLIGENTLLNKPLVQKELKKYLENNIVDLEGLDNLPIEDQTKRSNEYASWVKAYGASIGKSDLDIYLLNIAKEEPDLTKLISIIDFQNQNAEIHGNPSILDSMLEDPNIRSKLESAINSDSTSSSLKTRIGFYLGSEDSNIKVEDPPPLEDAILTMSTEEKSIVKRRLEDLLGDPSLKEEDRNKIQHLLDSNY